MEGWGGMEGCDGDGSGVGDAVSDQGPWPLVFPREIKQDQLLLSLRSCLRQSAWSARAHRTALQVSLISSLRRWRSRGGRSGYLEAERRERERRIETEREREPGDGRGEERGEGRGVRGSGLAGHLQGLMRGN